MIVKIFACLLFLFVLESIAIGQTVYTPERGTAERKALLDTARVPVERDMKQKNVFVTNDFNVQGNWAFISGTLQTPNRSEIKLKGTVFEDDPDFFENNFFILLNKTRGKWRSVTHAIGCTDVCYALWWREHKAPKAIFPYTE